MQHSEYQPIQPNTQNHLVSEVLGLALVRWTGSYRGVETTWLRWATLSGDLLLTPREVAEQERQRAEQERQRAEQAESQLKQVVLNLSQAGMSIEQITQATGLTALQVQEWLS